MSLQGIVGERVFAAMKGGKCDEAKVCMPSLIVHSLHCYRPRSWSNLQTLQTLDVVAPLNAL